MSENKSTVSKQTTYNGIGDYWASHESDESFFKGDDLEVKIDLKSDKYYLAVEGSLADDLSEIAAGEGVKPGVLVNRWIREKIAERREAVIGCLQRN